VPESFKVLVKELQSLCLDVKVLTEEDKEIEIKESIVEEIEELSVNIEGEEEALVVEYDETLEDEDTDDDDSTIEDIEIIDDFEEEPEIQDDDDLFVDEIDEIVEEYIDENDVKFNSEF